VQSETFNEPGAGESKLRPNNILHLILLGARGGSVVEALRYKPEGRGIDSRWCHWNFVLT
jgi:hypothetical protein